MWMSKQQKQVLPAGGSQTGIVTVSGDSLSVRLDSEVRSPEVYGPAGYHWTPGAGDRVLVIKGEGERPCVLGVCGGGKTAAVALEADRVALDGQVTVNGIALEELVKRLAREVWEELG